MRRHRRRARAAMLSSLVLSTLSCSALTNVNAPGITQPTAFDNPQGALIRRAGAITDFSSAAGDQALLTGIVSDEFSDVSGGEYPADRRVIPLNQQTGFNYPYDGLSTARVGALRAAQTLERYNRTPTARIGELFAFVGATEIMFAENMCSGVPLADVQNEMPTNGPTLSTTGLLQHALAQLDSARTYGAGDSVILSLTSVLRGRALLDSGDAIAAGAAVAGVPANYVYQVRYDTGVTVNVVTQAIVTFGTVSVSEREGINGVNFLSAADPRVPRDSIGVSSAGTGQPVFGVAQYSSLGSPISLATGTEASLIRAEASLAAGDVPGWASALNALRTSAGIPPLSTDSTTGATADERLSVLFRERALWLFATGHRHGDLRRLVRMYRRATETVFPTGPYEGGPATYGTDVTFAPFGEDQNSYFHGCINRNP